MGFLPEVTNSVSGTAKNFADPGGFLFGNDKGIPQEQAAELDPNTRAAMSRNAELHNTGDMTRDEAYQQHLANTGLDTSYKGAGFQDMKDRFMHESGLGGEAMSGALQARMDKKYDIAHNQQQRQLYANVPTLQMQDLQAKAGMASMNNAIQARQNMAQYQNAINQEAARNQVVNNIGSMVGQVFGAFFGRPPSGSNNPNQPQGSGAGSVAGGTAGGQTGGQSAGSYGGQSGASSGGNTGYTRR